MGNEKWAGGVTRQDLKTCLSISGLMPPSLILPLPCPASLYHGRIRRKMV